MSANSTKYAISRVTSSRQRSVGNASGSSGGQRVRAPITLTHPALASEWHTRKNGSLRPEQVSYGSKQKIWWQCEIDKSHVWQAAVCQRTKVKGSGCPFCSGHRISALNRLSIRYPEVAADWHPTKNGRVKPDDVSFGSNALVWWQCQKDKRHVWRTRVQKRTGDNPTGCPFCSGKRVSKTNNLAARFPELAAQWHGKKNGALASGDVMPGSGKKVWWQCPWDSKHVYCASVAARALAGTSCPFCCGHRVDNSNSLAWYSPAVAAQWHKKKNGDLTPEQVTAGSNKKAWWQCPSNRGHVWEAVIASRALRGRGCPFCANLRFSPEKSLKVLFPHVAKEWHHKKNGKLTPDIVMAGTAKKVWWRCQWSEEHEWQASIVGRTACGKGCPFCAGKLVAPSECLEKTDPELAKEWHPSRNKKLKPADVTKGSNRKVWWRCKSSTDHVWQAVVNSRSLRGRGCPFCAGNKASSQYNLAVLYPAVARQWHRTKNGRLKPSDVTPGSHTRAWWQCSRSVHHVWQTAVKLRTGTDSGCPYCSGHKVAVDTSLEAVYPLTAKQWHPSRNGSLKPSDVTPGSTQKVWWRCFRSATHVWQAMVANVVKARRDRLTTGCPFCADKEKGRHQNKGPKPLTSPKR